MKGTNDQIKSRDQKYGKNPFRRLKVEEKL